MKNTQRGFAIGIVIAIVAILAVGGGAVYVASRSYQAAQVENNATSTAEVSAEVNGDIGGNISIRGLIGLGRSLTCTFTDTSSGTMSEGTVRIADGKVRGDFSSTASGAGTVQSHMITDGEDIYVWSDSMKQGFKMKMTATTDTTASTQAPDINKEMSYDCDPWTVDAAVFTPPANVSFIDGASIGAGANANVKIPSGVNGSANVDIEALMNR